MDGAVGRIVQITWKLIPFSDVSSFSVFPQLALFLSVPAGCYLFTFLIDLTYCFAHFRFLPIWNRLDWDEINGSSFSYCFHSISFSCLIFFCLGWCFGFDLLLLLFIFVLYVSFVFLVLLFNFFVLWKKITFQGFMILDSVLRRKFRCCFFLLAISFSSFKTYPMQP